MKSLDSISTISHKLRTPLTVIISTVNNLLDGAFGSLNAEQKKWLKKLETHTNNLEMLVNDLLAFLKGNSQQSEQLAGAIGEGPGVDSLPPTSRRRLTGEALEWSESRIPTILIVDDEPDILDVIKEALEMQGLKPVTASTGDEAIRLASEIHPDVIFMDVLLQNQNGLEICRRIKSKMSAFTPVVLMTGQQDLREKITGSPQEADEILIKPFQMVELTARVASMLKMKKLRDELGRKKNEPL